MPDNEELMLPTGDDSLEVPGNETQVDPTVDGGADLVETLPEKVYTQEDFDNKFKSESGRIFNKQWAKEMSKLEDVGFDRRTIDDFKSISQRYGVQPRDLVRHVMAELVKGAPVEQGNAPQHDPRVDQLLQERSQIKYDRDLEKVTAMWEKDFGKKPTKQDIEEIEDFATEKGWFLEDAYKMVTRDTIRETAAKRAQEDYKKNLALKAKGKTVPGAATKVTPGISKNTSLRDALTAAAGEIEW